MKEVKCKLCLKEAFEDLQTVGELTDSLHELLFKLRLDISKETLMCFECMENLQVSLNFILNCIYMKDNAKNEVKVDLRQFDNANNVDSGECRAEKKCYFCTKSAQLENLASLNESEENMFLVDIIQNHIPELNLHSTEELLTCQTCFGPLQSLLCIINCLDARQKLLRMDIKIEEMENKDLVGLNKVQFTVEPMLKCDESSDVNEIGDDHHQGPVIKVENKVNDERDLNNEELTVKTEEIDIKLEQNDHESFQATSAEVTTVNGEPRCFQCKLCPFRGTCNADLEMHHLIHETPQISTYKCNLCTYETKCRDNLNDHMLTGKHTSVVTMDKLTHECASEIISRKWETEVKNYLDQALVTHTEPSETARLSDDKLPEKTLYSCETCTYETIYKRNLKRHSLTHKNSSEVPIYTCETCTYETKHKRYLMQHLLTHKDTSNVTIYKCEICSHKTKYKRGLIRHMVTHRDPSEISMYKCGMCTFETKLSTHRDRHMLIHRKSSDVPLQKCEVCTFETKLKKHLVRHMLTHKSPSETTMYKCDICWYETKYKLNLSRHMLTHQKHKRYLIRPMSVHENAADDCL